MPRIAWPSPINVTRQVFKILGYLSIGTKSKNSSMAKFVAESERLWLQPLNIVEHFAQYHIMMSEPRIMFYS